MTETQEQLQLYAKQGCEQAFRELVTRYVNLVYSTALRRVNDNSQMAQDVAQMVFTDLAHKAKTLPCDVALGGWLHRHTCFTASTAMRNEQRRQTRERIAVEMNTLNESTESNWKELALIVDDVIDQLDTPDREAIVLRFFEQLDFRSVGSAIGVSEDAAQKTREPSP